MIRSQQGNSLLLLLQRGETVLTAAPLANLLLITGCRIEDAACQISVQRERTHNIAGVQWPRKLAGGDKNGSPSVFELRLRFAVYIYEIVLEIFVTAGGFVNCVTARK